MPPHCALGFLLVAGVVAAGSAAGCGEGEPATTVAAPKTVTATTPSTATITLETPAAEATRTVEGQVEQTATAVPVVTFAGQRGESIGALEVEAPAVLRWSCPKSCERFAVSSAESDDPRLALEASGSSGKAEVSRGSYTAVRVQADSAWTMSMEVDGA
jgi:hypothetical protein